MNRLLILFACSLAVAVCPAQADPDGPLLVSAHYMCVVPPGLRCPRVAGALVVYFDEEIDAVTVSDVANYTFHPVDDPEALIPVSEVRYAAGNSYILRLTALPDTVDHLLTVFDVEDLDGNPMTPQSALLEPGPDPSAVPDLPALVAMSVAPNPFNPATEVSFVLRTAGQVDLAAYDLAGRWVAAIEKGHLDAGEYRRRWNATGLASGSYLLRLRVGGVVTSRKVSLVR